MKLDNRKNVFRIWMRKLLITAILTTLVITIGFTEFFMTQVLGIDKTVYLIAVVLLYILAEVYNFLLNQNYVSFSDNGDKIILRYYPVRILNSKKNSIEIPKQNFISWEIKKFFFGRGKMLYVSGKFKSRVATYPGISLTAVNESDRKKIIAALNTHVKRKFNSN